MPASGPRARCIDDDADTPSCLHHEPPRTRGFPIAARRSMHVRAAERRIACPTSTSGCARGRVVRDAGRRFGGPGHGRSPRQHVTAVPVEAPRLRSIAPSSPPAPQNSLAEPRADGPQRGTTYAQKRAGSLSPASRETQATARSPAGISASHVRQQRRLPDPAGPRPGQLPPRPPGSAARPTSVASPARVATSERRPSSRGAPLPRPPPSCAHHAAVCPTAAPHAIIISVNEPATMGAPRIAGTPTVVSRVFAYRTQPEARRAPRRTPRRGAMAPYGQRIRIPPPHPTATASFSALCSSNSQRPLRLDASVLEHHDVVGPTQRRRRCDTARHVTSPPPSSRSTPAARLDIQRARQVVDHQQLRPPLPASAPPPSAAPAPREHHPPAPNRRLQPRLQRPQVGSRTAPRTPPPAPPGRPHAPAEMFSRSVSLNRRGACAVYAAAAARRTPPRPPQGARIHRSPPHPAQQPQQAPQQRRLPAPTPPVTTVRVPRGRRRSTGPNPRVPTLDGGTTAPALSTTSNLPSTPGSAGGAPSAWAAAHAAQAAPGSPAPPPALRPARRSSGRTPLGLPVVGRNCPSPAVKSAMRPGRRRRGRIAHRQARRRDRPPPAA
jgi:hypothetical protein